MTLVELIQEYRAEHGLSQRQFANECGLSNGYISMLERGENPKTHQPIKPTMQALKKLAEGMHMNLTDLFTVVDDMLIDMGEGTGDVFGRQTSAPIGEGGWSDLDLEIVRLILSLSPKKKQEAIGYLRYLSDRGDS